MPAPAAVPAIRGAAVCPNDFGFLSENPVNIPGVVQMTDSSLTIPGLTREARMMLIPQQIGMSPCWKELRSFHAILYWHLFIFTSAVPWPRTLTEGWGVQLWRWMLPGLFMFCFLEVIIGPILGYSAIPASLFIFPFLSVFFLKSAIQSLGLVVLELRKLLDEPMGARRKVLQRRVVLLLLLLWVLTIATQVLLALSGSFSQNHPHFFQSIEIPVKAIAVAFGMLDYGTGVVFFTVYLELLFHQVHEFHSALNSDSPRHSEQELLQQYHYIHDQLDKCSSALQYLVVFAFTVLLFGALFGARMMLVNTDLNGLPWLIVSPIAALFIIWPIVKVNQAWQALPIGAALVKRLHNHSSSISSSHFLLQYVIQTPNQFSVFGLVFSAGWIASVIAAPLATIAFSLMQKFAGGQ